MSSFAVTFALAEAGKFIPIGTIVQKICNDEFNIHVEVHRAIIRNELSTEVGRASFQRIKGRLKEVYTELVQSELDFNSKELFADGKELAGLNLERLNKFVLYSATDVFNETGVENPFEIVTKNPLDYMDDWINMDNSQSAPQEQKTMNYFLGGFSHDLDNWEKTEGKLRYDAAALV
jgi:ribonucleoside-diphosphate reductase beta chain